MAAECTINIGRNAEMYLDNPTDSIYLHASIGAAVLGVFLEQEFIEMYRDPAYSDFDKAAPYVIAALPKFEELSDIPEAVVKDLIRSTVEYEIPNISQMVQAHGRPVIKGYDERHEADLKEAIEENLPWLNAANKLQQTKWMINKEVLEVILKDFDKLLKPVPPRPRLVTAMDVKNAFNDLKTKDTQANRDKYNNMVNLWNKELESISASSKNVERSVIRQKALELAYNPKYEDGFYQYVECDYRGRLYYQEPLTNYQGPDMARGLMLFAEGKRLGQDGMRWLAVHTANSFNQSYKIKELPEWISYDYAASLKKQGLDSISVDKMTLRDREVWTWENMDMILDSADKLVDCEKPVGFLACCLEWKKVQVDGFETISHLPVAIDGTCNGPQHLAAIAKDEITGELVSLSNQEVPSDLYSAVSQALVKKVCVPGIPDDKGNLTFSRINVILQKMSMKEIRKGLTKRAVMTRSYSAGKDTIADSMYKDCHTEGYTDKYGITMLDCVELADIIYELIKEVCPGPTRTMKFLQDMAIYELGKFEYYDVDGKKVSKSKRNKLHKRNVALRKKKAEEITPEELKELNEVSSTLDSHELRCIYGNGARSMDWVTPSGFHVIYEAWRQTPLKLKVTYPGWSGGATAQTGRITMSVLQSTNYPNIQAYQAGISPNFIHSLDATHMAAVIDDYDGHFGAVHDSFSTHAADMEELSRMTREKFFNLYNVENAYEDILRMVLSPCVVEEEDAEKMIPEQGTLQIEEVLKSSYFFS